MILECSLGRHGGRVSEVPPAKARPWRASASVCYARLRCDFATGVGCGQDAWRQSKSISDLASRVSEALRHWPSLLSNSGHKHRTGAERQRVLIAARPRRTCLPVQDWTAPCSSYGESARTRYNLFCSIAHGLRTEPFWSRLIERMPEPWR